MQTIVRSSRPSPRPLARWLLAGATVLTTAGLFGATATAASAATKASPSASAKSRAKALSAFTSCLAKHGVKLPSHTHGSFGGGFTHGSAPAGGFTGGGFGGGGFGGGGRPPGGFGAGGGGFTSGNSKYAKAFRACQSKLPKGGFFGFGGHGVPNFQPTAAQQAALTKFDECMAAQGVKVATNSSISVIHSLMTADPTAARACESDLSGVFGRPRPAPTTGTTASTA
jgi:hypothetical protein